MFGYFLMRNRIEESYEEKYFSYMPINHINNWGFLTQYYSWLATCISVKLYLATFCYGSSQVSIHTVFAAFKWICLGLWGHHLALIDSSTWECRAEWWTEQGMNPAAYVTRLSNSHTIHCRFACYPLLISFMNRHLSLNIDKGIKA